MNTRKYYLAYGMNTNLEQMAQRCPDAKSLGKVKLRGHKLAFKTFCDAVKSPGDVMECVLWSITDDCERALDVLEGYPDFYGKKEVEVYHNNQKIRAMIYYMTDYYISGYPSESYLRMVIEGYHSHSISGSYISDAIDEVLQHEYHTGI